MFSSKAQLKKRTPENGTDRENFLALLVDEYLNSSSFDAKCQVLANLANFAYDPVNYGYIRDVGVLDIFLHVIKNENNQRLLLYASAGICNNCLDPQNAEYILLNAGLEPLTTKLLEIDHNDIVLNIITTLIYLSNNKTQQEICSKETIHKITNLLQNQDKRVSNIATIFLQDICNIT